MKIFTYLYFFITCFLFVALSSRAMNQRIVDSLENVIQSDHHDTVLVGAYLKLSEELAYSNTNKMISLCDKALSLIEENIKKTEGAGLLPILVYKTWALNNIGYAYKKNGNFLKALGYYKECLSLKEDLGLTARLPVTLINIGAIYDDQGNIEKAIEFYSKALSMSENVGDKKILAYALNNLGGVYKGQREYKKAMENYLRSLELHKEVNNHNGVATAYNNIATLQQRQGNYEEALQGFQKSLKIREENEERRGIASCLNNMGVVFDLQGQTDKAIEYFEWSLAMRQSLGYKKGVAVCLKNLGKIYLAKNELGKAVDHGSRAFKLSKDIGYTTGICNASNLLKQVYIKLEAFSLALDYHKVYRSMRDSLYNAKTQKAAIKQQFQYEHDKEFFELNLEEEKQLALKAKEAEKTRLIIYVVATGLVLALIFLIILANRLMMIQRQRNVIRGHKEVVALQNKDIVDSIHYAKRIQKSVLPSRKHFKDVFPDSFILYKPKEIISGDFYWLYETGDTVYFSASDCPGRGVPGALMSIIGSSLLNDAISSKGLSRPSEILDEVKNEYIQALELSAENTLSGDDMKAVLCAWNKNGAMQYAAANMSLLIIRDGQVIETYSDNRGIGFSVGPPLPFTNHSFSLKKGDTLYMYSDGYQNQFGGEKGKKFRVRKLRSLLAENASESMEKQQHILETTMEDWRGSTEQVDDILVMGLKLN